MHQSQTRHRLVFALVFIICAVPTLAIVTFSLYIATIGAVVMIGSALPDIIATIHGTEAADPAVKSLPLVIFGLALTALIGSSVIAIYHFLKLSRDYLKTSPMPRDIARAHFMTGQRWGILPLATGTIIGVSLMLQPADRSTLVFSVLITGLPLIAPIMMLWRFVNRT